MRPVCFMIMPYGTKKTDQPAGQGLPEINFDRLWDLTDILARLRKLL